MKWTIFHYHQFAALFLVAWPDCGGYAHSPVEITCERQQGQNVFSSFQQKSTTFANLVGGG